MKKSLVGILLIIVMVLIPNCTFAALQANGNEGASKSFYDWIKQIREMESLGGVMGLEEEINDNLTSKTPNNIDVHMERNTEYGAIAILSASSYGNPNVIDNGETTTGNATGIYMYNNSEGVAAEKEGYENSLADCAKRYKDYYTSTENWVKKGDAMYETAGWHRRKDKTYLDRF